MHYDEELYKGTTTELHALSMMAVMNTPTVMFINNNRDVTTLFESFCST